MEIPTSKLVGTMCLLGVAAFACQRHSLASLFRPDPKSKRKEEWDCTKTKVKAILQAWLHQHPGQQVTDEVLAACRECILSSAPLAGSEVERSRVAVNYAKYVLHDLMRVDGPPAIPRTPEEWLQLFPRYPSTEDGFVRCYDASNAQGIRESLHRFGLCVVRVLDAAQCDASVSAMFEEINARRTKKGIAGPDVDPLDDATWFSSNWPSSSKFLLDQVALHRQAFANRCSPRIYEAFAGIFGEKRLHVSVDNWGVHRGARGHPKWAVGLKPHWDLNPWRYVQDMDGGFDPGYQGLVALTDQTVETGCHLTLPGCTRFVRQWCRERQLEDVAKSRKSHRPSEDDPVLPYMQPIPLRQGEMVIWSWGQLHGSCGSSGEGMRLQQYIRMYPAPEAGEGRYEELDRYACSRVLRMCLKKDELSSADVDALGLDARGRCLLGLSLWD